MIAGPAFAAAPNPADVVLAENGTARITRADYDAELSKLKPEMRGAFAVDPRRVGALVDNLLVMKTLAAQARAAGVERRVDVEQRLALENARLLATVEVEEIEKRARAAFDAKRTEFEARAREIYRVEGAKYDAPETVKVSHILLRVDRRGRDAAEAAARAALAKIRAGADFAAVAKETSDDPAAKTNGGELGWVAAQALDPEFAKAAFDLKKDGEVSEPVLSRYGYHLIRLEGRRPAGRKPFDEVKEEIMTALRDRYVDEAHNEVVAGIRKDPKTTMNKEAMDAIVHQADAANFVVPLIPLAPKAPPAN
jgi:peptidyl-prolyl cis-trans isomerase C